MKGEGDAKKGVLDEAGGPEVWCLGLPVDATEGTSDRGPRIPGVEAEERDPKGERVGLPPSRAYQDSYSS